MPESSDLSSATTVPPEPAGPQGPNRSTLAAICGAIVIIALVAVILSTRGQDEVASVATQVAPITSARASGTLGTELSPTTAAGLPQTGTDPIIETVPPSVAATAPPNTHPLPPAPYRVAEAVLRGELPIFDRPGAPEPVKSLPNPILYANDPKAALPLVMLVRQDAGAGWLEVFLPVRPNGATGFVRSADMKVTSHDFHIEVKLSSFSLRAFKGQEVILDTKIGIASDATPTPGGLYYTNMLFQPPNPDTAYGTYAYGLSGYSDTLKAFNGGPGQLGIHGTNEPNRIGQKVSHGCIRLRNEDIEKLVPLLPLGVPVLISA